MACKDTPDNRVAQKGDAAPYLSLTRLPSRSLGNFFFGFQPAAIFSRRLAALIARLRCLCRPDSVLTRFRIFYLYTAIISNRSDRRKS